MQWKVVLESGSDQSTRKQGAAIDRPEPIQLPRHLAFVHERPGHLIRRAQQISVSAFIAECADLDVTPVQYAALAAIETQQGIDQAGLAGLIAIDRVSAGHVITRLVSKELITRRPDTRDRRYKRLSITDEGRTLLSRIRPRLDAIQDRMMSHLSGNERDQLIKLLSKMVNLNNEVSRAPFSAEGLKRIDTETGARKPET